MDKFFNLHRLVEMLEIQHELKNNIEVSKIIKEAIQVLNSLNSDKIKTIKELAQLFYLLNGISKEEFYQKNTRKREIVDPRQAFEFLAHKVFLYKSESVADFVGKANHSIVLHNCKIVTEQFKYYKQWLVFWKKEIESKTELRF